MGVLVGRTALVTGGGQGIGRAVCEALAEAGASISIADIAAEAGADSAEAIRKGGGQAHFTRCNVAKAEDVDRSVAETIGAFGRIDVLVNAAQYFAAPRTLERTSMKDWELSHATGPLATLRFMQACLPYMKERGGSIVNFTSGSALTGMKYTAAYSAAKGAITALSKVAANEWATHGIRVNILCPFALTPVQERMMGTAYDNYTRTAVCSPMRRGANPRDEIAPVVVFLASDASRFMTGTVVHADGGLNELSPVDYGDTPGVFSDEA
jgi:NAD(P)-dependent dehydrogenase (short-subunit alcohol dehydrogenase family)